MKFSTPIAVKEIAEKYQAKLIGSERTRAKGINQVHLAEKGDVIFVDVEKYYDKALKSNASVVLINKKVKAPRGKTLLYCKDPFEVYNQLVLDERPIKPLTETISPTAEIHPSAILEPNVIIGHHVKIGANCYIQANVTIGEYSILGDHVTVQSGVVIGSDAFYYSKTKNGYRKWRSGGRVIIEDHVEIGAACTINKGVSGDTVIGEGTKLDCQVQVGHEARIGKHCLIAAQVGISGNTIIGNEVTLYGQVGVVQNLTIGDRVTVLGQSGVSKDLEKGKTYFGSPANEARAMYKEMAALRHLPEFFTNYYK